MLALLSAFTDLEMRPRAAADLAREIGCKELLIFTPDPELEVLLPALGLPQTLRNGREVRSFLAVCRREGWCVGEIPSTSGEVVSARGVLLAGGAAAVLLGGAPSDESLAALRPGLDLLAALFTSERRVQNLEVRLASAREHAVRATALTRALQDLRAKLEGALAEADSARIAARDHADESEALAEELQLQATELEVQARELELLNTALADEMQEAEQAREAADMANLAKSDFLATMSHELRTPINAIIGYTQLIEMEVSGPITAEQKVQLERILSSSQHLLVLINEVLDLVKIEAGEMKIVAREEVIQGTLREALALIWGEAGSRSIDLVNECEDPERSYVGDANRVRQILINLIANAVKFTEPGGRVNIRCGSIADIPDGVELQGAGPWTFVEVSDTGIGIAPEELQRIFMPFIQGESGHSRTKGGTGLGLTISRQLARLMGGDLTVRSEFGMGSRFTLWLPTVQAISGQLDESIRVQSGISLDTR